jgi:hypothetical protein
LLSALGTLVVLGVMRRWLIVLVARPLWFVVAAALGVADRKSAYAAFRVRALRRAEDSMLGISRRPEPDQHSSSE